MLQVVGFVRQQGKGTCRGGGGVRLGAGHGVDRGLGAAQSAAAVTHPELVFRQGLAAKQGQLVGGAVDQNRIAEFGVHGKALRQLPLGREIFAAVDAQAVVAAGLGDHPGLAVPVKHCGEGEVEVLLQGDLPLPCRAVVVQLADLDAAETCGQVHGLGVEPAAVVPVVEQRVGVPEAGAGGQHGVGGTAQGGQRVGALGLRHGAHGDGVDLFFARKLAQQPFGRDMQSAVKLVHWIVPFV